MAKLRVSLANKCQLLFGAAVVLILTAALTVVWFRMQNQVFEAQRETAYSLALAWLNDMIELGQPLNLGEQPPAGEPDGHLGLRMKLIVQQDFDRESRRDEFLDAAIQRFQTRPDRIDRFEQARDAAGKPYYRYARAVRKSELERLKQRNFERLLGTPGSTSAGTSGGTSGGSYRPVVPTPPELGDPVQMVLLVELRPEAVQRQQTLNLIYIIAAGLLAGLFAIVVFWLITTRLVLSPVRVLRETAEKVSEGDMNIRSSITTGDEFEQLSDMFNQMLENLRGNEDQLRSINKSLDLKLGELAETNVALYEANKIKTEFLANVSHELRTPLNSIIGFAEVLQETLKDRTGPVDEKRKRYIHNIITSSHSLLDLINDLLDLAKIEAGRVDVRVDAMSVADTAEGLINLIRPQANKAQLELEVRVEKNIPLVQTDPGKVQQILFNFLSNAVKFTPAGGKVRLEANMVERPNVPGSEPRVCFAVSDTGPGIPDEMQERIFEKFTQLDSTVTKAHGGTGLGLTISRELAKLLQGEIEVESQEGFGATFRLVIPTQLQSQSVPLMPNLANAAGA